MTERFEERFLAALLETAPAIAQVGTSAERSHHAGRARRGLAIALAAAAVAVLVGSFALGRLDARVVVTPGAEHRESPPVYLSFPDPGTRREVAPRLTMDEQAKLDSNQRRFVERGGDRNRAVLYVGESNDPTPTGDTVATAIGAVVFKDQPTASPTIAYWSDSAGRTWFVRDGGAGGVRIVEEQPHTRAELIAFIESLTINGDEVTTRKPSYKPAPNPRRQSLWRITTPAGDSLSASTSTTDGLSLTPGAEVAVRGTTGVVQRSRPFEPDMTGESVTLTWEEHDQLFMLSLSGRPGTEPRPDGSRAVATTQDLVDAAQSLQALTETQFLSLPYNAMPGFGSDGDVVIRLPEELDTQQGFRLAVIQRDASGTIIGTPIQVISGPLNRKYDPASYSVPAEEGATEVLVWVTPESGPSGLLPPPCAKPIPIPPRGERTSVDLDLSCVG